MANVTVIGAQWGDEGKGKIVDWLASRADAVVRFQGGHNAGHTLVVGDKTYKLSLLPAQWAPHRHEYGNIKVDISAVGPYLTRIAGEVADPEQEVEAEDESLLGASSPVTLMEMRVKMDSSAASRHLNERNQPPVPPA